MSFSLLTAGRSLQIHYQPLWILKKNSFYVIKSKTRIKSESFLFISNQIYMICLHNWMDKGKLKSVPPCWPFLWFASVNARSPHLSTSLRLTGARCSCRYARFILSSVPTIFKRVCWFHMMSTWIHLYLYSYRNKWTWCRDMLVVTGEINLSAVTPKYQYRWV